MTGDRSLIGKMDEHLSERDIRPTYIEEYVGGASLDEGASYGIHDYLRSILPFVHHQSVISLE